MSINQKIIKNHRVSTLTEIKAIANANEQTICYCDETDQVYRYVINGAGYTVNNDTVLTTGVGGNTRWVSKNIQDNRIILPASGVIDAGDLVIINPNSTVSAVEISGASNFVFGTPVTYRSGTNYYSAVTYDPDSDKVIVAFCGASYYGYAVVGTVVGDVISFGTPVLFHNHTVSGCSVTYDTLNDKIVIAYYDESNSNYGTAVVGSISGSTISFGTPVVFEAASTSQISTAFDSVNGKVVISYRDVGNSNYGTAVVGTVSGTSISFGTPTVFESATIIYTSSTFDSVDEKIVVAYCDAGNSNYGTAVVGTVSGTSISFGTPVVFESATTYYCAISFDSTNGKVVISYSDVGNSNYGTAVVGTVSGTSISFGTPAVFESAGIDTAVSTFDNSSGKICVAYRDTGNSNYLTAVAGSVSGSFISFSSPIEVEASASLYLGITYNSALKEAVVINASHAVVSSPLGGSNVTQTNFIGISQTTCADSELCTVGTSGFVDENQSGLTPAQTYYIADGSASLSASGSGIVVGVAITSSKILIGTRDNKRLMLSDLTFYGNRNINSLAGGTLNIAIGNALGDDFTIGTGKVVVRGSNGDIFLSSVTNRLSNISSNVVINSVSSGSTYSSFGLGTTQTVNGQSAGLVVYYNNSNSNPTYNHVASKNICYLASNIVTTDSNADGDSGCNFSIWTKPEGGVIASRVEVQSTGLVNVVGEFTAGTKTFFIDHPADPENKTLTHAVYEGPNHGLKYPGKTKLVNGKGKVNIDEYFHMTKGTFKLLAQDIIITSMLNQDSFDRVRPINVTNEGFEIICENPNSTDTISWELTAVRADRFVKYSTQNDDNGRLILENDKPEATEQELIEAFKDEEIETEIPSKDGEEYQSTVTSLTHKKGHYIHYTAYGKNLPTRKAIYKMKKEMKKEI